MLRGEVLCWGGKRVVVCACVWCVLCFVIFFWGGRVVWGAAERRLFVRNQKGLVR
eukprot:COSAG02_NODE_6540_length_3508_cov_3.305075_1_plen_54_part_10